MVVFSILVSISLDLSMLISMILVFSRNSCINGDFSYDLNKILRRVSEDTDSDSCVGRLAYILVTPQAE